MATTKIRNISGNDLVVPTDDGDFIEVPANHQGEFDADHAKALLQQTDVWERVKSDPPKDKE